VTTPLHALLARCLPELGASPVPWLGRVALRSGGHAHAVTVAGHGGRRLLLAHGDTAGPVPVGTHAVLSIDLEPSGVRLDLAVEVLAWGRVHAVLRIVGAPLVLRRRLVRDRALADAVGAVTLAAPAPDAGIAA